MLTLSIDYTKDEELLISPEEIKTLYLYGVPLKDKSGHTLSNSVISNYIISAQHEVERFFRIKLFQQIFEERLSFFRDDFENFGYIKVSYPVTRPLHLEGWYGTIRQITYPDAWLSSKKVSDGLSYRRSIYIVPNQGAATTGSLVYSGIIPYLGILSYPQLPDFWNCRYITGYNKVPQELLNIIGMLSSIPILLIAGDLILAPGISSQSISIDGLSQSLSSTKSASSSAYSARVKSYQDSIKETVERLRLTYTGIGIATM